MSIKNLRVAYKNLLKGKMFSFINIFGLSIGFTAFILIVQYVNFEFSFEKDFPDFDRMYRIRTTVLENGKVIKQSALSDPRFAKLYDTDFPEVESHTQLLSTQTWFDCSLRYIKESGDDITFNEKNIFFADSNFLHFFKVKLIEGDERSALTNPHSVIMTRSAAARYFGKSGPIGKSLSLKGSMTDDDLIVTGLMEEMPANSHLENIDIIVSMPSAEHKKTLREADLYNFVKLKNSDNLPLMLKRLQNVSEKDILKKSSNASGEQTQYSLDAVQGIYLQSELEDEIHAPGDSDTVYFLLAIALFILIIAWINYINFSTSRSVERSREVAVRKVLGAGRFEIIRQLMLESIIVNGLSIFIALILTGLLSDKFYSFFGNPSYQNIFYTDYKTGIVLVLIVLTGSFVSGFLPARLIAMGSPVDAMKGIVHNSQTGWNLRKVLVIFQFFCATSLLITIFVLYSQFDFMKRSKLQIDISKTLVLRGSMDVDSLYLQKLKNFKEGLMDESIITSVTTSSSIPGDNIGWTGVIKANGNSSEKSFLIQIVDQDFVDSYQLKILAGRNFSMAGTWHNNFGTGVENVIINQLGTQLLNFESPEAAIGQRILWGDIHCQIIGVVNDFHQRSLKVPIEPTLFTINKGPNISLKLNEQAYSSKNIESSLNLVRDRWRDFFPDKPFDYIFLEDHFARQYEKEAQFINLFKLLCGLAAFVSCLGLFGLSNLSIKKRQKEIGIRKILGSTNGAITILFALGFLKLVVYSVVIALPFTWFLVNGWLDNYAYKVSLSPLLFIIPMVMVFFIAAVTVSFQTFSISRTNPIKVLKQE